MSQEGACLPYGAATYEEGHGVLLRYVAKASQGTEGVPGRDRAGGASHDEQDLRPSVDAVDGVLWWRAEDERHNMQERQAVEAEGLWASVEHLEGERTAEASRKDFQRQDDETGQA